MPPTNGIMNICPRLLSSQLYIQQKTQNESFLHGAYTARSSFVANTMSFLRNPVYDITKATFMSTSINRTIKTMVFLCTRQHDASLTSSI